MRANLRPLRRDHWQRAIERLDPQRDYLQIYRISSAHEFPWDYIQALSLALFRTYAVPSIGALLAHTGEFTTRPQKRYDDTALILGAILEHGPRSEEGRTALRRMNQMHRSYSISNDDLRYVLSTFVVVPKRWLDDFGWRALSEREVTAATNYYRMLGARMNIHDIPENYAGFEQLMDGYERAHFGPDGGGRAVADATLSLLRDWYPGPFGRPMLAVSIALMDDPLREAFGYPAPSMRLRTAVRAGLKLRARLERLLPPRRRPFHARMSRTIRSYPAGFDLAALGTFPAAGSSDGG